MDSKPEPAETTEASPSSDTSNRVENVRGIQGYEDYALWKEKHLAHDADDLKQDLEKFRNRPRPEYLYPEDPSAAETGQQIAEADARADVHGSAALEKMTAQDARYQESVHALGDHGAGPFNTMNTLESFQEPPQVKTAEEDMVAYRYSGDGASPAGRWVTPERYGTPEARKDQLALPEQNAATQETEVRIAAGAHYLEGQAAPRFDRPGGGRQYYLMDDQGMHRQESE